MHIFFAIVGAIIEAFNIVLLVYCVSSWFIRDPFNKFMRILSAIVDPVLDPIRAILSHIPFISDVPIDFSPLIAFFILDFVLMLIW